MKSDYTRREFIHHGSLGLAGVGLGAGALTLRADAEGTPASGDPGDYAAYLKEKPKPAAISKTDFSPTEDNILGPFYREGAPYRAKITPPCEEGMVLLIRGRVWGQDTRKPLAGATIDIWQANAQGRNENEDRNNPPAPGVFRNRERVFTDEHGYYEYETVHPGRYLIAKNIWRPSHIHYLVRFSGYKQLVTQLYFQGDPMNKADEFIKESLIIEVRARKTARGTGYEEGTFDIVL